MTGLLRPQDLMKISGEADNAIAQEEQRRAKKREEE
jgi:hypothetical protein